MTKNIKILLVDDHKILRDGIKAILSDYNDIEMVGECEDGDDVLNFLEKQDVDVILMDIKMKRLNGIDATRLVTARYPNVKIIALSTFNEEIYLTKMLKQGASGYILKNTGEDELIRAIKCVNDGDNYFSEEVTAVMMAKYLKKERIGKSARMAHIEKLTKREKEILKLIIEELTNNRIAEKLFISPRTVDTHRRNLLQKIGVKNTAGLVRFAYENKIFEEDWT
ncbi:MAG: response regulator transcription factor [Bacteroidia bacterium]|nr:response regulator transcription factor [Bacteroidia bacterium]